MIVSREYWINYCNFTISSLCRLGRQGTLSHEEEDTTATIFLTDLLVDTNISQVVVMMPWLHQQGLYLWHQGLH
jgi:hypothetical protein